MKTLPDGRIQVEKGDTLYGIYGPNWKALSGYTGDPTKLPIGTILPAKTGGTVKAGTVVKESAPAPAQTSTGGVNWTAYYQGVLANPTATESAKAEARQKLAAITPVKKGEEGKKEEEKVPDWLASNDYFKQLSPDDQTYLINYYNILKVNDTEKQNILKQAFIDAQASADPYFKEKIRMAQDELLRALGEQKTDLASKQKDLTQKIEDIKTDLATGTGRLSIDEQAELARQQRNYEYELENLRETAATSGLTFSSRRALAEGRLATEQTDIVESTKRSFQRQIEDLQTAAARGDRDAQNLLSDYERIYGENVTKLGRATETYLGTTGLPSDLKGYRPLGGVVGTLEEEKLKDITQRAEALANLRNPFL